MCVFVFVFVFVFVCVVCVVCLCVYLYVCVCVCVFVCNTHVFFPRVFFCVCTHTHVCIHTRLHACMCVRARARVVFLCVFVCVCMDRSSKMRYPSTEMEQTSIYAKRLLYSELRRHLDCVVSGKHTHTRTHTQTHAPHTHTHTRTTLAAAFPMGHAAEDLCCEASPFDLFYYYNSSSCEDVCNCGEHVDRGLFDK